MHDSELQEDPQSQTSATLFDYDKYIKVSECIDLVILRKCVQELWNIIDDIDTISDVVKGDKNRYYELVVRKQSQRFHTTPIVADGYALFIPKHLLTENQDD